MAVLRSFFLIALGGCVSIHVPVESGSSGHPASESASAGPIVGPPEALSIVAPIQINVPAVSSNGAGAHGGHGGMPAPRNEKPGPSGAGYSCPMHPEVTSRVPDRCPKCGMELESKPSATEEPR